MYKYNETPAHSQYHTSEIFQKSYKTEVSPVVPSYDKANFKKEEVLTKIGAELQAIKGGFPVQVFPEKVREIIEATNKCLKFNKDFSSAAVMFATSIGFGNTHKIKVMEGWITGGVVYMVLVGDPGTNKSHPLAYFLKQIFYKDNQLYLEWLEKHKSYKASLAAGDTSVEEPVLTKNLLNDATVEAVSNVHYYNPRGIGIYVDEFAGFLKDQNKYRSGSDGEYYLSIWNGQPVTSDRASKKPIRIQNPNVSIIGTIQYRVALAELKKEGRSNNGWLERCLYVMPNDLKREAWGTENIDPKIAAMWGSVVDKLFSLSFDTTPHGESIPYIIEYSDEAKKLIYAWQANIVKQDNESGDLNTKSINPKIETYVHRFALILHMLQWACADCNENNWSRPNASAISAETAKNAIKVAEYFRAKGLKMIRGVRGEDDTYSSSGLTEQKKEILKALPTVFGTSEGVEIATLKEMPRRTFEEWLKDKECFKHLAHGRYQKIAC